MVKSNGLIVLPAGFARRRKSAPGQQRSHPEQSLQTRVAGMLSWLLPPEVFWTAVGHGGGGKLRGAILKGMGMKAGVPDILIIYGTAYWIELKAGTGLSDAQKTVHAALRRAGALVTVCKSTDEVLNALAGWGIPTREKKTPAERAAMRAAQVAAKTITTSSN